VYVYAASLTVGQHGFHDTVGLDCFMDAEKAADSIDCCEG
jgi:hypothetical protein